MSNDFTPDENRAYEILDSHAMDCTCDVCAAYTAAKTPREGLQAAARMVRQLQMSPYTVQNKPPTVH